MSNTSIDQLFVEFVVKSLVGNPDAVSIVRTIDEKGVLLELTVDPEDLGRVIGKRGATAQSIRTLLRALGTKNDARYNLKIVDNSPEDHVKREHRREEPRDDVALDSSDEAPSRAGANLADSDSDFSAAPSPAPVTSAVDEDDEDDTESIASKTRKELEDLDDLDV
jgi:predicted RNA-binding protein YlqC (UPF0109 family)